MARTTGPLVLAAISLMAAPSPAIAASRALAECDAQVRQRPESPGSYRCFYQAALRENAWREAAERLDAILSKEPQNQMARGYLAQIEADRGNDRAEGLFQRAADGFLSRGNRLAEAYVRIGFGYFLMRRQRLDRAREEASKARSAAQAQSVDPFLVPRVAVLDAAVANEAEEYGRAWTSLKRVEPALFPAGPLDLKTFWLSSMGKTCWATGRHEEAFACYRREAELTHSTGNLAQEANARYNMMLLAATLDQDREDVVAIGEKALGIAVESRNLTAEARIRAQLALHTTGSGAFDHATQAVALAREMKNPGALWMALRAYGHAVSERDPASALDAIEESIALSRALGNYSETARNLFARSRLRWIMGPREQAVADSLEALDAVEASRNLQPDAEMRARRLAQWGHAYATLAGHLLSGHLRDPARATSEDIALAFSVLERGRARSLLDMLDAARATSSLASDHPARARRDGVLEEIGRIQRRLSTPDLSGGARTETLAQLERLEVEEAALREEIARSDPAFASARRPSFAGLKEVQDALRADEALLLFQMGRRAEADGAFLGGSWLLAVTPSAVIVQSLPDQPELEPAVALFVGLLARRDGSEPQGAVRLYRTLLSEALAKLPDVRRLVILPDQRLHDLPFGALRVRAADEPIAARYEITLAPSATLWLRWRKGENTAAEIPAVALADPTLPTTDPRQGDGPSPERRSAPGAASGLHGLEHARAEGRSLVHRLGGGSRLLAGGDATERFIKTADLKRFGIVHFAAHAVVDDEHPDRSAVLLAPGGAKEDGFLQIREVADLDLAGRLVVLSACRSASGAVWNGEGVMGLARAFFQAGASGVVGSLWPVRDEDAAAFFEVFYRHLARGDSVAAAVAGAQRDRMRAGAPAAAWAGAVLLGDGAIVPFPGGRGIGRLDWWAVIPLVGLLGLAALLSMRARRAVRASRLTAESRPL